jgi:hypothetical protein
MRCLRQTESVQAHRFVDWPEDFLNLANLRLVFQEYWCVKVRNLHAGGFRKGSEKILGEVSTNSSSNELRRFILGMERKTEEGEDGKQPHAWLITGEDLFVCQFADSLALTGMNKFAGFDN